MKFKLPMELATQYQSNSQIARVVTEAWVEQNLYCPNCGNVLTGCPPGTRCKDFDCDTCGETYQLKSGKNPLRGSLIGAEYNTTLRGITSGNHPSIILMQYGPNSMKVIHVRIIHRSCITPSCVKSRKPLSSTARRAGWQGCSFMLDLIPAQGKLDIVSDSIATPKREVLQKWNIIQNLMQVPLESRGWRADVLKIVEMLPHQFSLDDLYSKEQHLAQLHPDNLNIRPQIRRQMQELRDAGLITFVGRGQYEKS